MIFRKITFKTRVTVLILYSSHDYANTYRIQTFLLPTFSLIQVWHACERKEFGGGLLQKPQNTCIIKYNKLRRQTMQNASFYFHCSMQSSSTNREYLDTIIVIWGCMWTNKEKQTHWLGINVLSSKPPTNINMPFTHTNTYAYQDYMNNKKYTHTTKHLQLHFFAFHRSTILYGLWWR